MDKNKNWKTWTPKPGDKIVCLNNYKGAFDDRPAFTKGKVYEVIELPSELRHVISYDEKTNGFPVSVYVVDDSGKNNGWHKQNFMPYTEATKVLYG